MANLGLNILGWSLIGNKNHLRFAYETRGFRITFEIKISYIDSHVTREWAFTKSCVELRFRCLLAHEEIMSAMGDQNYSIAQTLVLMFRAAQLLRPEK